MKVKTEEGIILRQPAPKNGDSERWRLHGVAALAMFAGVTGPLGAFCGWWEKLSPVVLLGSGAAVIALWMFLCAVKKNKWFYQGILGFLLVISAVGRTFLTDGACLAWNYLSGSWTELTGQMLPTMQIVNGRESLCFGVFCVVFGCVMALFACGVCSRCKGGAAVLLPVALVAVYVGTGAELPAVWILLTLLAALFLLLCSGWSVHSANTGASAMLGLMFVLPVAAVITLALQSPALHHWTQQVREQSETRIHVWRYETDYSILPEGDLSVALREGKEYTALQVTMEKPERLFLRSFVGDTFLDEKWNPIENRLLEENKETLYWLYHDFFFPQGQLAAAAQTVQLPVETQQITVRNINGCSETVYIPYTLQAGSVSDLSPLRLGQAVIGSDGLHGERLYYLEILCDGDALTQDVLKLLQESEDAAVLQFRQAESGYRNVVRTCDLQIPESFQKALGELLDACCAPHGERTTLTTAQAQASALDFLTLCFEDSGMDVPLPVEAVEQSSYQYTTVAVLALRYYGIPARYAEGYEITADMAANATAGEAIQVGNSCARAWVEIYQEGTGWMPMEMTPGFESLVQQAGEDGIKPVGVGGVDPNSQIGSAAGNGNGVSLGKGTEKDPDSTQKEDPSQQLSGGGTLVRIAKAVSWAVLALIALVLLSAILRRAILLKKRQRSFVGDDPTEAIGWIYADAARLLSAMGLDRQGGSMDSVCDRVEQMDEEYGTLCREMTRLNYEALFSSHKLEEPQRQVMLAFHRDTVQRLKHNAVWRKRLWMKWVQCLY